MNKYILLALLVLISATAYAQPSNDDCGGLIDLGQAPFGSYETIYNNVGATPSNIGSDNKPSCFDAVPQRDVWFQFKAAEDITQYNIRVVGLPDPEKGIPAIYNPEFAIYRGPECGVDKLFEFACASLSTQGNPARVGIDTIELSPGSTYYVRVNNAGINNTQPGGFQLFVTELLKPLTVADQGVNTSCFGTIYDSGGPEGNYQNNEDLVYTICPSGDTKCIEFNLEYYNLEKTGVDSEILDQLTFYDGKDTNATRIGQLGKDDPYFTGGGVVNGGGVNYTVKASSGCITLRFRSNDDITLDGFKGTWRCLPDACQAEEPLKIKTNVTTEEVIENIARNGMEIKIDTIACSKMSYGVFESVSKELRMTDGIILSTGNVLNAIGPNTGKEDMDEIGTPGDPDLNALIMGDTITELGDTIILGGETFDACALELEVFAPTDELSFDYVFASEEYPEFVNLGFNDIFGFFISGEGIEGKENLAVLPGTETVISINSVNMNTNWEYYQSNEFFGEDGIESQSSLEMDGMIVDKFARRGYLTASRKITPCKKYTLKFVVADQGDEKYNSAVMVSRIRSGAPSLSIEYSTGLDHFIETCTPEQEYIDIRIPGYASDTVSYDIEISGTATPGTDYTASIPSTVTFLPGETNKRFPIQVLSDNIVEGTETIVITLSKEYECGTHNYEPLTINIKDAIAVDIALQQDTIAYCEGTSVALRAEGGDHYRWLPADIFDDNLKNPQTAKPKGDLWVVVEGRTGICSSKDSIFLKEQAFSLELTGDTDLCPNTSSTLSVISSHTTAEYQWKDNSGAVVGSGSSLTVSPTESTTYTVTATPPEGCEPKTATISVSVFPEFTISDITFIDEAGTTVDPSVLLGSKMIKAMISTTPILEGALVKWYVNGDLKSTTTSTTSETIDLSSYAGAGTLEFRAEVIDANGCLQTQNTSVSVENNVKVIIPNAFSPDGDGNNDRFRPVSKGSTGIEIVSFQIYNRWGNLVYNNENGLEGWDGTYNGDKAPAETYVYKISYRSLANSEVTSNVGEVTLLR